MGNQVVQLFSKIGDYFIVSTRNTLIIAYSNEHVHSIRIRPTTMSIIILYGYCSIKYVGIDTFYFSIRLLSDNI
jgi:hypothetical protein